MATVQEDSELFGVLNATTQILDTIVAQMEMLMSIRYPPIDHVTVDESSEDDPLKRIASRIKVLEIGQKQHGELGKLHQQFLLALRQQVQDLGQWAHPLAKRLNRLDSLAADLQMRTDRANRHTAKLKQDYAQLSAQVTINQERIEVLHLHIQTLQYAAWGGMAGLVLMLVLVGTTCYWYGKQSKSATPLRRSHTLPKEISREVYQ
jgi:hypothetical protein